MNSLFLLIALAIAGAVADPVFFRGRQWGEDGLLGKLKRSHSLSDPKPAPAQWFNQTLNHFDPSDDRIWQQRYFVNDSQFEAGGPVFLQLGGEGTANPIWLQEGQIANRYSPLFGALSIYLEHRFYGKSHPTPDTTVDSLKYLTSEQSLADAALFISKYAEIDPRVKGSKWVAFGGSYSGSLAAWLRLKYPHLVHASVASSAPVQAVVDFSEYLGVVRDSLGSTCDSNIKQATQQLAAAIKDKTQWPQLSKQFNLCEPLDGTNQNDVMNLVQNLAGNFEGIVQYNRDNRAFEGAVDTNVTIDTLCGLMSDSSTGKELDRYAAVNSLLMKTYGQSCLEYKYDSFIKQLQDTTWNSSANEGGRQWTYQTCVEFGFFQSSDLANQPFGSYFPVSFFEQQCKDIFGSQFTIELLQKGVEFTNANYGGYGLRPTRVCFPNGSIDPWHYLGITNQTDVVPESLAVFIEGTAHCADMYPDSSDDLPALSAARQQVVGFLAWSLNH